MAPEASFENGGGQLWQPLIAAWLDVGRGKLDKAITIEQNPASASRPPYRFSSSDA